jgi:hypothetical protein
MHRSSTAHIPLRSALLVGPRAAPRARVGVGAVVAAETGPSAGAGGFSPPGVSSLSR